MHHVLRVVMLVSFSQSLRLQLLWIVIVLYGLKKISSPEMVESLGKFCYRANTYILRAGLES